MTTTTPVAETPASVSTPGNTVVSMTITIDGDYDTVVGHDKQKFLESVKSQLASYLRLPLSCIINMDSKPGSIVVIFDMIASTDPNFPINVEAIKAAKVEFEQKIKQNKVVYVDFKDEPHPVLSSVDNTDNVGHKTENTGSTYHNSYLILGLAVGAVVVMIILIIITACAVRSYMYRKYQRQIRPRSGSVSGSAFDVEMTEIKSYMANAS